jgi:HAMP domain-containing protein
VLAFKDWPLRRKIILPTVVITAVLALALGFVIEKQQRDLAVSQARRTSEAIAEQIRADRQVYSEKVVAKMRKDGIDFQTSDIKGLDLPKRIPLPASFVHLTSEVVNKAGYHQVDLLSLWNINPAKKPRDTFEQQALERVARYPDQFEESVTSEGKGPVYKRVVADVASAQLCVDCHNNTDVSPRKDFRLNDVMGGLIITLPLEAAFAEARSNAIVTTLSLLGTFVLLLLVISAIQLRYISRPLVALEKAADRISMGEMEDPVKVDSDDEVGKLAKAFERMRVSLQAAMKQLEGGE